MKATELLVNQHREVEQLFEQLESFEEGDEKIVREELARNLIGHMVIEEEMFYPAMREAMPEHVSLAEVEHAAARYALAQWAPCRVNIDYHVEVEHHPYSVPYQLIGEQLEARYTASTVEVMATMREFMKRFG